MPKGSIITPTYKTDNWTHKVLIEYNGCELLCNDVIKSFKERDENDISNFILKGEGFKYIDLCPICDRLFHKNRKDKEYCSLECSKVGSMRKIRAKK